MHANIPFSTARLDALLDDAGIDLLIVTSKHNIQCVTLDGDQAFGDGGRGWNRIPA